MHAWVIWLVIGVSLLVAEMVTLTFYLLWLGVGALLGALVALALPGIWGLQVAFAGLAALLLTVFTKPLTRRIREGRGFRDAIDELIGKQGVVVEPIASGQYGVVQVGGELWTAKSTETLVKGERVLVLDRGNTVVEVQKWRSV